MTTKIENITRGSDKYPRALKDQNDKTALARSAVKLESHKNHFISEIKYQIYSSQMFLFLCDSREWRKKIFHFFPKYKISTELRHLTESLKKPNLYVFRTFDNISFFTRWIEVFLDLEKKTFSFTFASSQCIYWRSQSTIDDSQMELWCFDVRTDFTQKIITFQHGHRRNRARTSLLVRFAFVVRLLMVL